MIGKIKLQCVKNNNATFNDMKVKLISWQVKYQSNEKYVKSDSELSQNKKPNEFE